MLVSFSERFFSESHYNFQGPSVFFLFFEFLPLPKNIKYYILRLHCDKDEYNQGWIVVFFSSDFKRNESIFSGPKNSLGPWPSVRVDEDGMSAVHCQNCHQVDVCWWGTKAPARQFCY